MTRIIDTPWMHGRWQPVHTDLAVAPMPADRRVTWGGEVYDLATEADTLALEIARVEADPATAQAMDYVVATQLRTREIEEESDRLEAQIEAAQAASRAIRADMDASGMTAAQEAVEARRLLARDRDKYLAAWRRDYGSPRGAQAQERAPARVREITN